MFLDFAVEEIGVDLGFEGEEGLSEAGGESGSGFLNTLLSSCDFSSVARVEVVNCLLRGQLGDGWQNGESVTGQEDDVLRMGTNCWQFGVLNELERIGSPSVFSDGDIVEVDLFGIILEDDVFQNSSESDGVVDLRLFLLAEAHAFGVASSFDVEHTIVSPDMFVVSDKVPVVSS